MYTAPQRSCGAVKCEIHNGVVDFTPMHQVVPPGALFDFQPKLRFGVKSRVSIANLRLGAST